MSILEDGSGKGYKARVTENNRLSTEALTEPFQHAISREDQQAYQVASTVNLASGTLVCLHIKNNDSIRDLVITFIRHQIVGSSGGTAFPNTSNYFRAAFGRTRSSGGTELTPVNMFGGEANLAEVTVYQEPTLTGTAKEFDKWYTQADGDMNRWNKEGSLILPVNKTLELSYISDHTSGIIYTRLSFVMRKDGV